MSNLISPDCKNQSKHSSKVEQRGRPAARQRLFAQLGFLLTSAFWLVIEEFYFCLELICSILRTGATQRQQGRQTSFIS